MRSPAPCLKLLAALPLLILGSACSPEPDLVLYVAHDQVYSEPLIQRFEEETGLRVRAEYDSEASKTIGLVNRIRNEKNRPRCDVFWNNEVGHSVALAGEGILASYDSPSAAEIPSTFRDSENRWTGFAARARIFIVNTEKADPAEINGMQDLLDPKWTGQVGMARPLTGTTLTHASALFDVLGEDAALEYLHAVKAGNDAGSVNLSPGNGYTKDQVAKGQLSFGWTDTDDFNDARLDGYPVVAVYPDQDGIGTLLIPNTVAILEEAPHREAAEQFV
ncbi:MAG: iron(III) transport system substrate-binding protein, partial [Rhodothermales bacterium]